MKQFIFLCAALIGCTLFSSCYTSKKASKQTTKALFHYPNVSASILRDKFPCVVTDPIDTTGLAANNWYNDSIMALLERNYDSLTSIGSDTVWESNMVIDMEKVNELSRQLKQSRLNNAKLLSDLQLAKTLKPVQVPYPVRDLAEVKVLTEQRDAINKELEETKTSWYSTKDKLNWWRIAAIVTWSIIAVFLAIFLLLKLKRK